MNYKLLVSVVFALLTLAECLPADSISQRNSDNVEDIKNKLRDHFDAQKNTGPDGRRKFSSVEEIQKAIQKHDIEMGRGYRYGATGPNYYLTDPRCTKQGKLGCGARCFNPQTYTRCVNGVVIGPELKMP